jgi:hypothetical protein
MELLLGPELTIGWYRAVSFITKRLSAIEPVLTTEKINVVVQYSEPGMNFPHSPCRRDRGKQFASLVSC